MNTGAHRASELEQDAIGSRIELTLDQVIQASMLHEEAAKVRAPNGLHDAPIEIVFRFGVAINPFRGGFVGAANFLFAGGRPLVFPEGTMRARAGAASSSTRIMINEAREGCVSGELVRPTGTIDAKLDSDGDRRPRLSQTDGTYEVRQRASGPRMYRLQRPFTGIVMYSRPWVRPVSEHQRQVHLRPRSVFGNGIGNLLRREGRDKNGYRSH